MRSQSVSQAQTAAATRQPQKFSLSATHAHQIPDKNGYIPDESEKYMSNRQLVYFKWLLERMRTDIYNNNKRLVNAIKDDSQALPDENDRASKEMEFTVELRERERERRLLSKIDSTASRIDSKNFGYCNECGDIIGIKRLLARPVATLCIECKNLQERYEKSGSTLRSDGN